MSLDKRGSSMSSEVLALFEGHVSPGSITPEICAPTNTPEAVSIGCAITNREDYTRYVKDASALTFRIRNKFQVPFPFLLDGNMNELLSSNECFLEGTKKRRFSLGYNLHTDIPLSYVPIDMT
jgi:hypothetical protein